MVEDQNSPQVVKYLLMDGYSCNKSATLAAAALVYLRWADFWDAEQEAIAAFDATEYNPLLPPTLHWRSWYNLPAEEIQRIISERLFHYLEGLNNSRPNLMATHLHRIAPAVMNLAGVSPFTLAELIRWLADQPFETPNDRRALLKYFDQILAEMDFSFDSIGQLMVELAAPVAGERVYDPCFGTAGLLTMAVARVARNKKDNSSHNGVPMLSVFGVAHDADSYVIELTRLALAGIEKPQLELGNSLERVPPDNLQRDGFDVVLCNAPWSTRVETVGLDHYAIQTSDATAMFLQHALSQLRPNGRAVIVVPPGFLSRSGMEQTLRQLLLEKHSVESVIALPEYSLLPYTASRGSILVLRREGPTKRIRMADTDGWFAKRKGSQAAKMTLEKAEELGKRLRAPEPDNPCWDVDIATLPMVEWDLTPRRRDQSGLLGVLELLRAKIDVVPLKDCCRIVTRKALPKGQLLDSPPVPLPSPKQNIFFPTGVKATGQKTFFDIPSIPYVRVSDIKDGLAEKGSSWLAPVAVATVSANAEWKLKAGDLLLSKSGTIGKVGLVRNGAVGAIASDGIMVLRPEPIRLDPHYFLAYLESAKCRAWRGDQSRGETIRQLSKQVIEAMPVPLPLPLMQQRIAHEYRENGLDALELMVQLLHGGEQDPIVLWLDKIPSSLFSKVELGGDPLAFYDLSILCSEVRHLHNLTAHVQTGDSSLSDWVFRLHDAASSLRDLADIPRGPGLLSILQESTRSIMDALLVIKGHSPGEAKAREWTKSIACRLDTASDALLKDVKLVFSTERESLQAGEMIDLSLRIHNQGSLPLRKICVATTPNWGEKEFGYLTENANVSFRLTGPGPKATGSFVLKIFWSASRLDGESVADTQEIALAVVDQPQEIRRDDKEIGGSPYVCGDPVRPERDDVFFGREELLEKIRRQIVESGNVVLLEGNRRTGKSSILWHLEGPKAIPGWLGIYCSLQGTEGSNQGAGIPTEEVFRGIAYQIAQSLRKQYGEAPLPDGTLLTAERKLGIVKALREGISSQSPFLDFQSYLETVLGKLETYGLKLLLMLDEFDKLQEGIDSGVTSPQVPENIRYLIHQYPRLSAILTGSRVISRLRAEYWSALFGLGGTVQKVSFLSGDAARRLVVEPVHNRLVYSGEAVDELIRLTSGQPYLLQCLCNKVFALAAELKTRSIHIDLVRQVADLLISENNYLGSLWEFAGTPRRRLLLALAQQNSAHEEDFRFLVIRERLLALGMEIENETLESDLTRLDELELIRLHGESKGGYYSLTIPLLGTWIERQQDFTVVVKKAIAETGETHE